MNFDLGAFNTDLLIFGGFGAVLILIIIYIMVKDGEQSKKISYLEHSIDRLHNQLYDNQKELRKIQAKHDEAGTASTQNSPAAGLDDKQIKSFINQEVKKVLEPISEALNQTESSMKDFQSSMQDRFDTVENRVKQTVMMPETNMNDEEKIVSLYKEGKSVDDIAKQFRIGAGEVELIIKFANLNA